MRHYEEYHYLCFQVNFQTIDVILCLIIYNLQLSKQYSSHHKRMCKIFSMDNTINRYEI